MSTYDMDRTYSWDEASFQNALFLFLDKRQSGQTDRHGIGDGQHQRRSDVVSEWGVQLTVDRRHILEKRRT